MLFISTGLQAVKKVVKSLRYRKQIPHIELIEPDHPDQNPIISYKVAGKVDNYIRCAPNWIITVSD